MPARERRLFTPPVCEQVPELAASFECPPSFRVFGCQNPLQQGGGRKGLPKSFLNRFTQVATLPPLQG